MNVLIWIALVVVGCFGLGALLGAPFLPVLGRDVEKLIDLTELRAGQTLVDLGSGDGRLLRAAARRGIRGVGYEINPLLWAWSVVASFRQRELISFRLSDYWRASLPPADSVVLFGISHRMADFEKLFEQKMKHPLRVVSYAFELPTKKAVKKTSNTWTYDYS